MVEESAPLLQVTDLSVSYGRVQVLFGVNISVHAGEAVALLGTNGAGKSTLLKTVSGLRPPDAGTIEFDGRDITKMAPHLRACLGVVQLSGGHALFPGLSVLDNLRAGAFTFLRDRKRAEAEIERVLELVPSIRDRLQQPARSMSGGEQQMVALAKALLLNPRLLIIDELTLGLSPIVAQHMVSVVADLRERGITMLIVEQSLNLALAISGRAYFMEKGEVRFSGGTEELLQRGDLLRAVFLGGGT